MHPRQKLDQVRCEDATCELNDEGQDPGDHEENDQCFQLVGQHPVPRGDGRTLRLLPERLHRHRRLHWRPVDLCVIDSREGMKMMEMDCVTMLNLAKHMIVQHNTCMICVCK